MGGGFPSRDERTVSLGDGEGCLCEGDGTRGVTDDGVLTETKTVFVDPDRHPCLGTVELRGSLCVGGRRTSDGRDRKRLDRVENRD